jgi:Domain of unknown function (DUF4032)
MDTEENQARRLLNDLDYHRARTDQQGADEAIVAHEWLTEQFEPVVQSVPMELRAKLEPAELYHEVLEHRWFLSEQAGAEMSMAEASQSYLNTVLRGLPDEEIAVSAMESMGPLANRTTHRRVSPTRSQRSLTTLGRMRRPGPKRRSLLRRTWILPLRARRPKGRP